MCWHSNHHSNGQHPAFHSLKSVILFSRNGERINVCSSACWVMGQPGEWSDLVDVCQKQKSLTDQLYWPVKCSVCSRHTCGAAWLPVYAQQRHFKWRFLDCWLRSISYPPKLETALRVITMLQICAPKRGTSVIPAVILWPHPSQSLRSFTQTLLELSPFILSLYYSTVSPPLLRCALALIWCRDLV